MIINIGTKRKRGQSLRLRFPGIGKWPKLLWTSNVPTLRAGIHLYSCSFLQFCRFRKTRM